MSVRIHVAVRKRVIVGDAAIWLKPQNFASKGAAILRIAPHGRVARSGVEHPIGTKGEPPAVVVGTHRDASQKRLGCLPEMETHNLVTVLSRVISIHPAIGGVIGRYGNTKQTTLANAARWQALDLLNLSAGRDCQQAATGSLANQRPTIG